MPAADYISPAGELHDGLFPGVEDLTAHVEAVVARIPVAYDAATGEAWAYHRLYSDALLRLATRPEAYAEDGQASVRYGKDVLGVVRERKAYWQDQLDDLNAVAPVTDAPLTTRSVKKVRTY